MNDNIIRDRAAATVARILGETADALPAFEEHKRTPFHFDWAWEGRVGDSEYTYQKKYEAPVQGRKKTGTRGSSSGGGATGLAGMILPCPQCLSTHSVLAPCAKAGA